jgi:hypothetical protein
MLASSMDRFTPLTPIQHGRIREHSGSERTEVRRHDVPMRFHTCLAVVCCLVALQWLHWWTFLIAMTLIASLGIRYSLVSLHRDTPGSHIGGRGPLER